MKTATISSIFFTLASASALAQDLSPTGNGTIALQAHDPKSVCYFRNIRVKPL